MKTDSPWIHRLSIVVALFALVAILVGALLTSLTRPIAAQAAAFVDPAFGFWHSIAGGTAVLLMLGLAIAARSPIAWIALTVGLIDSALGTQTQASTSIFHALLGQLFFGCIVVLVVISSPAWRRGPDPIEDSWRPSLRSLAIAMPLVILLQTTLGASYRYRALGVLWHIMNAMIVLLLILVVAIFLVRQFPGHRTLRPAAVVAGVITSIQVALGFTTFMMLILFPESSLAVVITSVLHVTTGALTFGAGIALSILIRFNIGSTRSHTGQ